MKTSIKKFGKRKQIQTEPEKIPDPPVYVNYIFTYKGNSYPVECCEGDSLYAAWHKQKPWYLPGSEVTITDNHGKSARFVRGMI